MLYYRTGDYKTAFETFQNSRNIFCSVYGEKHPKVVSLTMNCSAALAKMNLTESAEDEAEMFLTNMKIQKQIEIVSDVIRVKWKKPIPETMKKMPLLAFDTPTANGFPTPPPPPARVAGKLPKLGVTVPAAADLCKNPAVGMMGGEGQAVFSPREHTQRKLPMPADKPVAAPVVEQPKSISATYS